MIGLEVHCELATATKLFCGCRNAFGDEPNVNICPVCLGLPGSLPVLNEQAVELAMRIGAALHCDIRPSEFARKNYFYPDQAKDYQISQYDQPLNTGGWLELPDGFRVGVTRAHMEEDTGKLTHVGASGRINAAHHALVDYNRSGVPLVEIVSEPDIRSVAHARAYAAELRGILVATGASDGRMEEGSMRVDANVSVRPAGSERVRHPLRDQEPQLAALARAGHRVRGGAPDRHPRGGGAVDQETRHWDESAGRTESMRSKEEANDYRYFPEPDLVPLAPGRRVAGAGARGPGADAGRPPGARWPPRWAVRRATPRRTRSGRWSTWASTGWSRAAAEAGAPAALALARAANEVAAQSEAAAAARCRRSFVSLLAHGVGRPAVGDPVQGGARRAARAGRGRPGGAGRGDGLRGARRRHALAPSSTRSSRPTPTSGPASSAATTS